MSYCFECGTQLTPIKHQPWVSFDNCDKCQCGYQLIAIEPMAGGSYHFEMRRLVEPFDPAVALDPRAIKDVYRSYEKYMGVIFEDGEEFASSEPYEYVEPVIRQHVSEEDLQKAIDAYDEEQGGLVVQDLLIMLRDDDSLSIQMLTINPDKMPQISASDPEVYLRALKKIKEGQ